MISPGGQKPKPVVLIVLDGWGISANEKGNAIKLANTPFIDSLYHQYPHTTLEASGEAVGLPRGEDGNTETGHLNIGAGQIVYQDLPRINQSIADGGFIRNPHFLAATEHVKRNNSSLHLMGLIGSGGVHSSVDHLYALLNVCKNESIQSFFLHLITDGRDSPPTSGINYVKQIQAKLKEMGSGQISTITGRYYAMDRDNRWERIEVAYKGMTLGIGTKTQKPADEVLNSYNQNITDEFIKPIINCDANNNPVGLVKENDAMIFFNFRIDRPRQITKAFVLPNFEYVTNNTQSFDPYNIKYTKSHIAPKPEAEATQLFDRGEIIKNLHFVTMTEYEKGLPVSIAFPPQLVEMPLGRVVAEMGLRQLRMAETEKERFVTFYMNGQREDQFAGEDRVIIPSPSVSTYDQKPEMSSRELTQTLIERIQSGLYDFIVINFANADMVAHTGNLEATIKACEVIDNNMRQIIDVLNAAGGVAVITADHGNAEELINIETGAVDTKHSTFPVLLLIVGNMFKGQSAQLPQGILADVAPTILNIMQLPKPASMSGRALV